MKRLSTPLSIMIVAVITFVIIAENKGLLIYKDPCDVISTISYEESTRINVMSQTTHKTCGSVIVVGDIFVVNAKATQWWNFSRLGGAYLTAHEAALALTKVCPASEGLQKDSRKEKHEDFSI